VLLVKCGPAEGLVDAVSDLNVCLRGLCCRFSVVLAIKPPHPAAAESEGSSVFFKLKIKQGRKLPFADA
jgi:hypothetical protein